MLLQAEDLNLLAIMESITRPGETKPVWIPDQDAPQCSNCAQKFTFTRRRFAVAYSRPTIYFANMQPVSISRKNTPSIWRKDFVCIPVYNNFVKYHAVDAP